MTYRFCDSGERPDSQSANRNSSGVDTQPEGSMTKFRPHLNLAVLLAVTLLIGWRPLVGTFALALRDAYTHILLILPVSAALIFLERRSVNGCMTR